MSLCDRGANGSVGGSDTVWIGSPIPNRTVNLTGVTNHQITNIPVGTVGAYIMSQRGPVIGIFHEFAYTGEANTVLSAFQMECHSLQVCDKNPRLGGKGTIATPDGYIFPLSFVAGLPYLKMRRYTTEEYSSLPHVIFTSDKEWDPTLLDIDVDPNNPTFLLNNPDSLHMLPHPDYDLSGEPIEVNNSTISSFQPTQEVNIIPSQRTNLEYSALYKTKPYNHWVNEVNHRHNEIISRCIKAAQSVVLQEKFNISGTDQHLLRSDQPRVHTPNGIDYNKLRPYFSWIPTKLIQETFRNSTQFGFLPSSPEGNLFKRWKTTNPAMNVNRFHDDVMTDTIYSDTKAIEGGYQAAQIFFGRTSHIIHIDYINEKRNFLKCFQGFVQKWGAPRRLLGDSAGNQHSHQTQDYLRMMWIGFWQSEPYYQHQNLFERRYQTYKRIVNRTMDRTNTPPELWYLCMSHVAYTLNRTADPAIHYQQPIFQATGQQGDISTLISFQWYEPVYFKLDEKEQSFPSTSTEEYGRWVGIAEHTGQAMTFKVWNPKTNKVLNRSSLRSARDKEFPNHKAMKGIPLSELPDNEIDPEKFSFGNPPDIIYSKNNEGVMESNVNAETQFTDEDINPEEEGNNLDSTSPDGPPKVPLMDNKGHPVIDSHGEMITIEGVEQDTLQGVTFLKREEDGTKNRVQVVSKWKKDSKDYTDFKIKYSRNQMEDMMTYNEIMNYIHRDKLDNEDYHWRFKRILSHQGPLKKGDPGWNNSTYNVEIEWENGEITWEPVNVIELDDPITLALYARDHNLLDVPGWKRFKKIASNEKKLKRLVRQAKLRSYRTSTKYMYGFKVPKTYQEAVAFDIENGNTKWQDAVKLEMTQLDDYDTFIDHGVFQEVGIPEGFQLIKVHLVFAVKHDGRHKARLVSRGDLTDIPLDSVYAGVVSLRGLRMCLFIAELNGMTAYATDIGNAYLEATTNEKVCIKAGSEFGDREGHLLIIYKALYGLRSSGRRFGDLLASCLKDLGFIPSKAEPEIFIRKEKDHYSYVACYVDDLAVVMKEPETFLKILQSEPYNFKLKGSGPMSFHLGCGFERDKRGILTMNPKKYIDKMLQSYELLYGKKPSPTPQSPLPENDHPELDTSEFLEEEGISQYQSLIGSLQWLISIGRWDIQTAVMSLSSFRAAPRIGHLDRVKRIYGYIHKFKHFTLKFRTEEPDMSYFDEKSKNQDWSSTVYGEHSEDVPNDAPEPLGKRVTLIHYFDANLMHDVLSGKAVTGCIHLANKTPIMWHSKKQATSETATYGAEFIAGRTCIEQVVDLRNTFRYLGVPIHERSYVFGDNESMINSSTLPDARLQKRHNILSYHYVRSMISRKFISMYHLKSANNLADILTKHWSHASNYQLLQPIFHHVGNTANLYIDDRPGCLDNVIIPSEAKSGTTVKTEK